MKRKKIGLALSGGGARGFAHIGAFKVLAERGIPIDMIAGTSAGSIVGAAIAGGMDAGQLIAMAERTGWSNMVRPAMSPLGLLSNAPMGKFLTQNLPFHRFEDLTMPYAAVVCDFDTGEEIALGGTGDLIFAIRASCAVPGVFAPMKDDSGRVLVDGGVVSPTPVDAVRNLGADIVIAVDLLSCGATFRTKPKTALGMVLKSAMTLLRAASGDQTRRADVVIEPQIAHLRPDEIGKRAEFLDLGEAAARMRIDEIEALIR